MKTLILLLFSQSVMASDPWICTEVSSQRRGNDTIVVCGVGWGSDESHANQVAFRQSQNDFYQFCDGSEDCKDHHVSIEPKRSECEPMTLGNDHVFKCTRLLSFTFSDDKMTRDEVTQALYERAGYPHISRCFGEMNDPRRFCE